MKYAIPTAGEIPLIPIPVEARCVCNTPATAIVFHERDQRGYYMCDPCADHNCSNRGGKLITISPNSILRKETVKIFHDITELCAEHTLQRAYSYLFYRKNETMNRDWRLATQDAMALIVRAEVQLLRERGPIWPGEV